MFTRTQIFTAVLAALPTINACTGPDINDDSIELIKEFEGFVDSPYSDPVGYPTVGYGHLCSDSDCSEVGYSFPLTEETGTQLLAEDLVEYQDGLTNVLVDEVTLDANQYGALVSWTFNMGVGAVSDSTLVARLNEGEDPDTVASEELPKWVYAGGEILPGLVRRRDAEVALFTNGTSEGALPVDC
ncbi:hypothetical protein FQN54_006817 [Arachnomyces sp. PD_36]|nr:hypothetical protein FQN54_006817 [Arachnomyces sp. PD_36]